MTNYNPLPRLPWKPVQFITRTNPNGKGIETDGEFGHHKLPTINSVVNHFAAIKVRDGVIYSMKEGAALADATLGPLWTVHDWNLRTSYYRFCDNFKIFPFASISDNVLGVWPFFEWLREFGVQAGGFTGLAQKIWRRSLNSRVQLYDRGKMGRHALYGGRKEARSGTYENMNYHDLASAFPAAMGTREYPRTLMEARPGIYRSGYALATIRIPGGLDWYPIPVRVRPMALMYGHGQATDYWTYEDLRQVEKVGGQIHVHQSWRGFDHRPIFSVWYEDVICKARGQLSGDALNALKMVANRLWSSFAVGGSARISSYTDDLRRIVHDRRTELGRIRYEAFIASEVQAAVRGQVFDALLTLQNPVYVDTDGIIALDTRSPSGNWRVKHRMSTVEIHSPQNYKWFCILCAPGSTCGGPHYCVAGIAKSDRAKERLLRSERQPFNPMFGMNLQAGDISAAREKHGFQGPITVSLPEDWWTDANRGGQQRLPLGSKGRPS